MRTGTVFATTAAVTTGTAAPSPFFLVVAVDCFSGQAASWKTSRQTAPAVSAGARRVLTRPENLNFIPSPKKAADSQHRPRRLLQLVVIVLQADYEHPGSDALARPGKPPASRGSLLCRPFRFRVQYIEPYS